MILDGLWRFVEEKVFGEDSTLALFNQYSDYDCSFDRPDAAMIRRNNLLNYCCCFTEWPTILLVGEAPGPKGCRFSGVPFTSEHQLLSKSLPFGGRQSSNRKIPHKEASATTFWSVIKGCEQQAFVWNCLPFHPHDGTNPMSIRAPTKTEIRNYAHILRSVIEILKPRKVVSIGNHAAAALGDLDIDAMHVRHPSHGGVAEFKSGVMRIFCIR
jgi:uracil-DNA glycosylase